MIVTASSQASLLLALQGTEADTASAQLACNTPGTTAQPQGTAVQQRRLRCAFPALACLLGLGYKRVGALALGANIHILGLARAAAWVGLRAGLGTALRAHAAWTRETDERARQRWGVAVWALH